MSIICPNFKNKEVKQQFDEIAAATSEQAAYHIWSQNNGNAIDSAPNGAPSKLFRDLLEHFNGDRVLAIQAKAKVYSEGFKSWFGDWNTIEKNPYNLDIEVSDVQPNYDSADINGPGAMFVIIKNEGAGRGNMIGTISINGTYLGKNSFKTWGDDGYVDMSSVGDNVSIDKEFRGKGYGKAAYFAFAKRVAESGRILRSAPDASRSEAATRVWESLTRDGYAEKKVNRYEIINNNILLANTSKVVDENGEPLLVWHGGVGEITEFKPGFVENETGIYFTSNYQYAGWFYSMYSEYAGDHNAGVEFFGKEGEIIPEGAMYPVFLNIKNPKRYTDEVSFHDLKQDSQNQDGIIADKVKDGEFIEDHYIVFDSNQIKSATENIGAFSQTNNNIYASQQTPQQEPKIIPLTDYSRPLYKHYNLLNAHGEVKVVDYTKASDIKKTDQWVAALNMNGSGYLFKVRRTPVGHKIFIYDTIPNLFGSNKTETEILSRVNDATPTELRAEPARQVTESISSNDVFNELTNSGDTVLAELATAVKGLLDGIGAEPVTITYVDAPLNKMFKNANITARTPALYDPANNTIYVSRATDLTGHPYSRNPKHAMHRILLHEIVHAYTVSSVKNDSAAAKKINEFFEAYKAKYTDYAATIVEEFVSELFSNPAVMQNMEAIQEGEMNMLQRFLAWLKSFFTSKSALSNDAVQAVLDLLVEFNSDNVLIANDEQIPTPFAANSVRETLAIEKLATTFDEVKQSIVSKITTLRYSKYDKPFAASKEKEQSELLYKLKTISEQLTADYQQDTLDYIESFTEYIDNIANSIPEMESLLASIETRMQDAISNDDSAELELVEAVLDDFYRNTLKPAKENLDRIYDTLTQAHNRNIYMAIVGTDSYQILLDMTHNLVEQLSPERMSNRDNIGYIYKNIAIYKTQDYLYRKGSSSLDPGIIRALKSWLEIDNDISFFERWVSSATSSKNFILRVIAKQINDVDNYVNRIAHNKFSELRKAAIATSKHMKLYELDESGKKTGFLVRDRKYGLYFNDRSAFRDGWLKSHNILSFNDLKLDKAMFKQYQKDMNAWIDARANRRYKKEYYDLFANLSVEASEALDEANAMIDGITYAFRDKVTKKVKFEDMDDATYEEYLYAVKRKRNLSNPYNYDTGEIKTGIEADIAKEITELNDKLTAGIKTKANMQAFLDEMARVQAESTPLPYGRSKYDLWLERNTRMDYTESFQNFLESRSKKDYGDTYAALQKALANILKLYRDSNNEVDYTIMPEKAKETVRRLDKAMAKIAASNKQKVKSPKAFNVKLSDIAIANGGANALVAGTDTYFDGYKARYYSYLTKLEPINPQHNMVRVPSGNWNESTEESLYWNPEYDSTIPDREQPKLNSRYDNRKAYSILDKNSPKFDKDLRNLYDTILDMMHDANSNKLHFLDNANDYKLPQKTGGLHNYIAARGIISGFGKWLVDKTRILSQDEGFGGDKMTTADGRRVLLPPTHYMAMLDDTTVGSNDLVSMIMSYYKMALNYEAKEKISHQLNLINDIVKDYAEYKTESGWVKSPDSNLSKKIDQLIKMFVYGEKTKRSEFDLLGTKISIGKIMDLFTKWGRDCGLAWNPRSALSGGMSAVTFYVSESKAGNIYNGSNLTYGTGVAIKEYLLMKTLMDTGKNVSTRSFLFGMMEYNGISFDQNEEFMHVNRVRMGRIAGRLGSRYNFFKLASIMPNSFALPAIYDNYRLVTRADGTKAFMSENDFIKFENIHGLDPSDPETAKQKKAIFNTFSENLWNAYTQDKDGKITIKPEYTQYITQELENEVTSKSSWLASHAEGMSSGVDRTGLFYYQASGAIFLFRYFLIKNIENAFAPLHWNYEIKTAMMGTLTAVFQGYLYGTNHWLYQKIYKFIDATRVGKSNTDIEKSRVEAIENLKEVFGDNVDIKKEITRYQTRFNSQIAGYFFWTFMVGALVNALVGGDDDDDYLLNLGLYMIKRVELETGSRYKLDDMASIFNSVSPLTKHFSNVMHAMNLFEASDYKKIKKGAYKGLYGWQRDIIRITPFLNAYYNMTNPKEKLNNLKNTLNR